jgi:phosphate-selective porin
VRSRLLVAWFAAAFFLAAPSAVEQARAEEAGPAGIEAEYGPRGLEVTSADGRFSAWFGLRAQLLLSYPFRDDPREPEDFDLADRATLEIRRARFKSGGHAYQKWLDYFFEYEILNSRLLDLRFTLKQREDIQLRVGQWKPEYNRERRDSSGELQFADRSIVTYPFTIDRQPGAMLMGRLWSGRPYDSHYYVGAFSGAGTLHFDNEGQPMWLARWQWNLFGRELPFTESDLQRRKQPHASLAAAALGNRSRYTRFSQSGGGALPGFPDTTAERYDVSQSLAEAALHWRGFSLQGEYHWKKIEDRLVPRVTRLEGAYGQMGYFFHETWPSVPSPLELAVRAAFVDWDTSVPDDRQTEITFCGNWFFHGHRNKLTLDVSRLGLENPAGDRSAWRGRFQWDVSF